MIYFEFENVEVPDVNSELFSLWIERTVLNEGMKLGDLTYVFCSDEYLLEMNKTFLNHDYYTDIITFDYTEIDVVGGDMFISIDRVADNATLLKIRFVEELKRVIIHGVLHLCGYKDKSVDDERVMRLKEDFYLNLYGST